MSTYYVSSGEVSSGIILNSSDYMYVSGGGTASNTIVSAYGRMYVSEGGIANHTTIYCTKSWENPIWSYYSGEMYVYGTANSTNITAHCSIYVYDGGIANETVLGSEGILYVYSGGTASIAYNPWNDSPCVVSAPGAMVSYLDRDANVYYGDNNFGVILKNNSVSDFTVETSHSVIVYSNGMAENLTINTFGTLTISYGGTANSTTVNAYGSIYVSSGGTANSTIVSSGGWMYVSSGGSANETMVKHGGYLLVSNGGTADDSVISGHYGRMVVYSGGNVRNTAVNIGDIHIKFGGIANNTIVNSGGSMYVSSGGTANSTTVNQYGLLFVANGGVANSTTVNRYGSMTVSSGGTASIVFNPWSGIVSSADGATVTYLECDANVYFGNALNGVISKGNILVDLTISNGQSALVYSNGTASCTTVNSGGGLTVSNGGTAADIVENGGYVFVAEGATVTFTPNTFSGLILSNTSATVHSGTTANSTTVNSYGRLAIYSGGTANSTTVNYRGSMSVFSGGIANNTTLNGEQNNLYDNVQLYVYNSGTVNSTTVNSYGGLFVFSGGSANSTSVAADGYLEVFSGGTATNIVASSGARLILTVASDTYIQGTYGGSSFEMKNALISGYTANSGSFLCVNSGGMNVGGTANSTTVNAGGGLEIFSGGTASSTIVNSGGDLHVFRGKVTGTLMMATGAIVFADTGSIIDFDLSGLTDEAPARINDLSLIQGTPNYTVTVTEDQAFGTYTLAEGAADFNTSVTVWRGETEIGSLSVGETITDSIKEYSLAKDSGTLCFTVKSVVESDTRTNLLENGVSQVLAWDASQGKVGFMATDGNPSPAWRGVWEWPTEYNPGLGASEAELWKVVGAGHFAGSEVEHDGILLYNGIGHTFAAWTNLNDPSYGYVSLCHVDGNFQTKCLADFDGNGFDDVIIYNEKGSVGIVSDAASYHDVWHVEGDSTEWQLLGAGRFTAVMGQDSILFRNTANGHLYLWDNQGTDVASWNWHQTDIGWIADGWEFAAIGDFAGDGVDDIVLVNTNDNNAVFVWNDGDQSTQHYVGILGEGFKIETVGDYNGDGKEDLLLREYKSGWGGIGCWASADATAWTDFNARIETDMESRFAVIA